MSDIKAGVVVVTKFCRSGSSAFSSYINYIDRDEAVRTEYSSKYNLYQDYMGNPEKTTGLFTGQKDIKTARDKEGLKNIFQTAQENGSLMWQTVISFDNRWLENNGLYNREDGILDEERIKNITRSAVRKMLEKEGLENAVWSAAIHYNTDNIHIHIATVEPEPMREKRQYIQYDYEEGEKTPKLDADGKPVMKSEYKGTFRQGSIEACKREMANQIINERENNLKINSIIRDSIVKQKREHPLAEDRELAHRFLELYQHMPDCNRNMWNYNNPIMHPLKQEIDHISESYLTRYHEEEYRELKERLQIQEQKYRTAYGSTERSYAKTKTEDLFTRLGNAILKEIRQYDKEQRNNEYAAYRLGKMDYEKKQYREAASHFVKSGDMYAHYYLGKIYLDKEGKMYDPKKGIEYMKLSAGEGNSFAELNLGWTFLKGEAVQRDRKEAEKWFREAASHGNEQAEKILEELGKGKHCYTKHHIRKGVSLQKAVSRMRKGMKSEWERARMEREHARMVEQSIRE